MSITFYQFLHTVGLLILASSLTHLLLTKAYSKAASIFYGISCLLLLVAGMGMAGKYGYNMASPWIVGKILIWFVLASVVPVIAKRFEELKPKMYIVAMTLIVIGTFIASYKPA